MNMNNNNNKETPDYGEPWACEPDGNGISIYARNDTVYSIQESFAWDEIYARRAVACVNACAGMSDPAAEIAELRRERNDLKAWKESALAVESEWDVQELAKMLGAKPGQSCRRVIHERVIELLADLRELWRLRDVLMNVATEAAKDLALVRCLEPSDTEIKRAIIHKMNQAAAARITEGGAF